MNEKSGGSDSGRRGAGPSRGGRGGPPKGGGAGGPGGGFRGRGEGGRPGSKGGAKPFRAREDRGGEGASRADRPRPARSAEGAPAGEGKPFRPRGQRAAGKGGEERRADFRSREGERGERPPFKRREGTEGGSEHSSFRSRPDRDEGGEGKSFTPRSRGMHSHGGRERDGSAKPPRSFGRLSHGSAEAERRERPGDRPARDGAPRRSATPLPDVSAPGTMRIAKRLARAGIASRRDAEGMIADGRVKVNGRLLDSPALDVGASDRIEIDGAPLPAIERTRLWLFHKPAGTVTTNRDPEGRPTVFDRLPDEMPRVLSVGRLDINTEGLLLLTNDGGLARILELPATGWLRRYRVRAHGSVDQARLDDLRNGIAIDGVFYGAVEATLDREQGSNVWLTLGLREGKNREVKKILAHLGLEVNRLIRVSFGPFQLGELTEGSVMEIKGRTLRDQLGERLIEEAGADFDAPITNPFSNKPVAAERAEPRKERAGRKDEASEWITASGTEKPNRKRFGERKREEALGRLETRAPRSFQKGGFDKEGRGERPERGGKPFGDRPERGDRPFAERKPRSFADRPERAEGDERRPVRRPAGAPKRTANVWMAPGARATGEKRKAERAEREAAKAERGERGPSRGPARGPRPSSGAPRTQAPRGPGGDRPRSRPGGGSGGPKRPDRG